MLNWKLYNQNEYCNLEILLVTHSSTTKQEVKQEEHDGCQTLGAKSKNKKELINT